MKDLIKKIEGLEKDPYGAANTFGDDDGWKAEGYNQALTDVINLIQEKPEKETPAVNR